MSTRSTRQRIRASSGDARPFAGRRQVTAHAAGVDIGAHAIRACVPASDHQPLVRAFGTSTAALAALADGGSDRGLAPVAMASTGVEWLPRFATLEARGLPCCVRSTHALPHVPGRPSAGLACQGMHTLQSEGVLPAACRPDAALVPRRPF